MRNEHDDQLDHELTNGNGIVSRRSNVENNHRNIKYGLGITFLVMLTAAAACLITKKMMEQSNTNLGYSGAATGNLALVNRTMQFFNDSDKISESNLMQGRCSELQSFIEIVLSMTESSIRRECQKYPSDFFLNSTVKCVQFTIDRLIATSQSACKLGLNGTFFGVSSNFVANRTTDNSTLNEIVLRIKP